MVHLLESRMEEGGFVLPMDMAARLNFIHREKEALDLLEMGLEIHDPSMPYLGSGFAMMENLYDEPRLLAILETMNLPLPALP